MSQEFTIDSMQRAIADCVRERDEWKRACIDARDRYEEQCNTIDRLRLDVEHYNTWGRTHQDLLRRVSAELSQEIERLRAERDKAEATIRKARALLRNQHGAPCIILSRVLELLDKGTDSA